MDLTDRYDCTKDVKEHVLSVRMILDEWIRLIKYRGEAHDKSKLNDPEEKALFDHWTPELRQTTFGTEAYKQALDGMGEGVRRHYKANRHHPEHYENGVEGMTLIDLVEMLADWMAAADRQGRFVNLEYARERWSLTPQLVSILANTLREEDYWNEVNGFHSQYCPPERRDGHVEISDEMKA